MVPDDECVRYVLISMCACARLNNCVALALLGVKTSWVSVLPFGPLGDMVLENCAAHSVEYVGPRAEGDLGIYTVRARLVRETCAGLVQPEDVQGEVR